MPPPPEYEPVHHEPGYGEPGTARPQDPRRPDDSPWRRTQRASRPEAIQRNPGPPVQASYDPGEFRPHDQHGEGSQYGEPSQYAERDEYA